MDCLICNRFNIKLEYCEDCLQPICQTCYNKLVSCPFCRKRFSSQMSSLLTLKLISKIEKGDIPTSDSLYLKVFFNLVSINLKDLAIIYAKKSTNPYIYSHLGCLLWENNKFKEAIESFQKGILNNCDDCKINLAKIFIKEDFFNLKESIKLINTVYDKEKFTSEINFCQGVFSYFKKDYLNAKNYLIMSEVTYIKKYHILAIIYKEEKDYKKSYEIIQKTNNQDLILEFSPDKRVKRLLFDQNQEKSRKKIKLIYDILNEK